MSSNSGSSISTSQERGSWGRGFPLKCQCGLDVVIYPSASQSNPGRPFFRCPTKKTVSKIESVFRFWLSLLIFKKKILQDHLFKWVEDGVYEEVVDSLPKFSIIENAIHNAKSEAAVEIQDVQAMIKELKEEALWSKRKIKKMLLLTKFCLLLLVFFAIGITVSLVMFCHSKKKTASSWVLDAQSFR
ncbi:hypothetical protein AtEden1_Chr2g0235621 [Arabidopsis thaliana]